VLRLPSTATSMMDEPPMAAISTARLSCASSSIGPSNSRSISAGVLATTSSAACGWWLCAWLWLSTGEESCDPGKYNACVNPASTQSGAKWQRSIQCGFKGFC
jgi:hypothetical protein